MFESIFFEGRETYVFLKVHVLLGERDYFLALLSRNLLLHDCNMTFELELFGGVMGKVLLCIYVVSGRFLLLEIFLGSQPYYEVK